MATRKNKKGPVGTGELKKYGYANVVNMTVTQRHNALIKAVKGYGVLPVFRKLNAAYILSGKKSPESSEIFKADRDWVMNKYTA